ncbi:MAG: 5-formyltetrahydrofolate cyclo-ligase [Lachnospiraceae bacterium]|nr:5-formyltetrahydrofolate cyclo-ligase [Lachnospiraceae bacterium]
MEKKAETDKRLFRKEALKKRDLLSLKYRERASEEIAERLIHHKAYLSAENIFLYYPVKSEVLLSLFTERCLKDGKKIYYPLSITGNGRNRLEFFEVEDPYTDLKPGYMGIPEPDKSRLVPFDGEPDLILVPGVCFDESLNRMGYGKGFYDGHLKGRGGIRAGLCFEELLYELIPHDEGDEKMDMVITEKRIISDGQRISDNTRE